jgi:hypothetical protein
METKVRISMYVPGAQLLSSQECEKNPKESYNTELLTLSYKTKKGKYQKETIQIKTRKNRTIVHSLNISKDAYKYMISTQAPTERLLKSWTREYNTPMKRLNWHMSKIAEQFGATSYSFEIFED